MFELYDSITAGFAGGVLAAASIVSVLVSIVSYVLIVIGAFSGAVRSLWVHHQQNLLGDQVFLVHPPCRCRGRHLLRYRRRYRRAAFRHLLDCDARALCHDELQTVAFVRPRRRLHLGADLYSVAVRADPRLRQLRVSGQGRINPFFRALSVGTCEKPRTDIPCAVFIRL